MEKEHPPDRIFIYNSMCLGIMVRLQQLDIQEPHKLGIFGKARFIERSSATSIWLIKLPLFPLVTFLDLGEQKPRNWKHG